MNVNWLSIRNEWLSKPDGLALTCRNNQLADQISAFADSGIEEYTEFYNLLVNWSQEIINSFSIVGFKRINNSYIESRNRQIEKLFYNANGYTNFRRTRIRILYCLNKNDTYKL